MPADSARPTGISLASVDRCVLPNGITLLVYPNPASPSVALVGQHAAGAVLETAATCGLAGLTADALNRGTASRSFLEFSAELDEVGASLGFGAGTELASLHGRALAEDLEVLLQLSADALQHAGFPDVEVERLRDQVLTGIAHLEDDPGALAGRRFRELLFGRENPYGRPDEGYAETVRGLTPQALRDFHARAYAPNTLTLVVVGAVDPPRVRELVSHHFGAWTNPSPDAVTQRQWCETIARHDSPARAVASEPQREDLAIEGKTQTEFVLGWLGVRRTDPGYYATMIANFILGQLGMGGRIGARVRDEQGLAYHASSYAEAGHARQPWVVRAGINPANLQRAVATSLEEVRKLCEQPPSDEELRLTKQAMIGSLPLRLERNDGIAGLLLTIERFELGLDYLSRYPDLIDRVTGQDVQDAAAAILSSPGYTLVTAGPELPPQG